MQLKEKSIEFIFKKSLDNFEYFEAKNKKQINTFKINIKNEKFINSNDNDIK